MPQGSSIRTYRCGKLKSQFRKGGHTPFIGDSPEGAAAAYGISFNMEPGERVHVMDFGLYELYTDDNGDLKSWLCIKSKKG